MMRSVIRPAICPVRTVRPALLALLAAALAVPVATPPALARKAHKPADEQADKDGAAGKVDKPESAKKGEAGKDAGKPAKVGTFGDWGAYLASGKGKTCYALAKPQERKTEGHKGEGRKAEARAAEAHKDAAYVFIADRPNEKVHNEVSIMMGFPIKESGSAQALVGKASFDLVAKGSNAWIKNPDEEAKFVEALQHSAKLVVKAPPVKGPVTVDSYSLAGLKQALAQVGKDCR